MNSVLLHYHLINCKDCKLKLQFLSWSKRWQYTRLLNVDLLQTCPNDDPNKTFLGDTKIQTNVLKAQASNKFLVENAFAELGNFFKRN